MQNQIITDFLLNRKIIGEQSDLIITSTHKIIIDESTHSYKVTKQIGSTVDYCYKIKEAELKGSIDLYNVLSDTQARFATNTLFETEGLHFTLIIFEKDEQKDPTLLPGKHIFKFW